MRSVLSRLASAAESLERAARAAAGVELERHEIGSVGFDDFFGLIGADYPSALPVYLGLRIPSLSEVVYVFVLASCDLDVGERVVGFRQLLTIATQKSVLEELPTAPTAGGPAATPTAGPMAGVIIPTPPPPVYLFERPVVTPGWHFSDGWASWQLRIEPARSAHHPRGNVDQASFVWRDSKGPALVYEQATFPTPQLVPGYLGLNSYAPPVLRGTAELVTHEIRYPWQRSDFWAINHVARVPERAILYGLVRQTNPYTRLQFELTDPPFPPIKQRFAAAGFPPEESFLQVWAGSSSTFAPTQYHRIAGALIVDKFTRGKR